MSNVTLLIAGREYKVACAPGEESHVTRLGRVIDGKLAEMEGASGQSEARSLLFAALLLADELDEVRTSNRRTAEGQLDIAQWLDDFAVRLENLAMRLEDGQASA